MSVPIWAPNEVPVYTAQCTRIPNERPLPKSPQQMREAERLMHSQHPFAKLRSSSSIYNCAGLVLAFRRTWIEDMQSVPRWLTEDGYRQLPDGKSPHAGDVVLYRANDGAVAHVGIILEIPQHGALDQAAGPLVLSKWGQYGEYVHRLLDLPPLGAKVQYWSERV